MSEKKGNIRLISTGQVAENRKARFNYAITDTYTAGISLIMYILLVMACWFFFINGLGMMLDGSNQNNVYNGLPIFLANLFGGTFSTIILTIKCKNMINAKAANLSEAKYCEEKLLQAKSKKREKI